jgi:hypothetical protein
MLITGLTSEEWRHPRRIRGHVYELCRLALTDDRHGWAYVCPDDRETLADDWDAKRFAAEHLASYIEACAAWRRRYDDAGRSRAVVGIPWSHLAPGAASSRRFSTA